MRGLISDDQAAAFLMALFIRGMNAKETVWLLEAMKKSGVCFDLSHIPGVKVDKHSTGGVGDGISLGLAPLVAACGIPVPMVAGRSLGHTGGTIDKLEAIPGFRTHLSDLEFISQIKKIGVAIMGPTASLAPADNKLYALRDVTGTVDSIPLISASILSKKIAEGCDALVLDVKFGSGAFTQEFQQAKQLAKTMMALGKQCGKKMVAILTNMDQPLGAAIGNAIEIQQAIEILQGREDPLVQDWIEVTETLGAWMLVLGGVCKNVKFARQKMAEVRKNGFGLKKFSEMIEAQGGDPQVCKDPRSLLPQAEKREFILAPQRGIIQKIDARLAGIAALLLGAGREKKDSVIDPAAGIVLYKKAGDPVQKGERIAEIHYSKTEKIQEAQELFLTGLQIGKTNPKPTRLIEAILR
jgi:pyrimidine-nucleoside phosphorylase